MTTPLRQQFRPGDFDTAANAASKIDYSFQQINRQLGALGNRQVLTVSFVGTASFPVFIPQIRLDKVAGFIILRATDAGAGAAPTAPPTPIETQNLMWQKVEQQGRPAYQITGMSGLTAGHRYTLTLEAVGG